MLLKSADSKDELISRLEEELKTTANGYRSKLERQLRNLRAGIKAEDEAAYLINFDYAKSPNWVVIHDLRLEVGGRVAQIDHLLINRFLECYVLETKNFHSGLKITEDGEFLRWSNFTKNYEGMSSPIAQNDRHIAVLKDAFKTIKLPTRLGMDLTPIFQSYVLVASHARVIRPQGFDTSRVIKADMLKATLDKQFDNPGLLRAVGSLARLIDEGTLYGVGRRLSALHKPLHPKKELGDAPEPSLKPELELVAAVPAPATSPAPSGPSRESAPMCKHCQGAGGAIQYGRFGYYFKCSACQENTSMRWDCGNAGHAPRLRKEGRNFYRECEGCGSNALFFVNPEA